MYVIAYSVTMAYFLLAAISPQATVIPNTWHELARLGVLAFFGLVAFWWGAVSNGVIVIRDPTNPSKEGYRADSTDA